MFRSPLPAGLFHATLALLVMHGGQSLAQEPYRKPPEDIAAILRAPPLPVVSFNPARTHMIFAERRAMPTISDLSQPMLALAGERINPGTNGPHGDMGFESLRLVATDGSIDLALDTPPDGRIGSPSWSPDGSRFAFTVTWDNGVEIWVGETATGQVSRLTGRELNLAGGGFTWMPGGAGILAQMIVPDRGKPPESPRTPTGPVVEEAAGRVSPVRTYQDLLQNPHDEELFDFYFTSRVVLYNLSDPTQPREREVGHPAIYLQAEPSPDGRYLLVTRALKPYSYQVPWRDFPRITEVLDLGTDTIKEIARQPLSDNVPIEGVPTGPRSIAWEPTEGSSRLVWAEALDGGDPKTDAPFRDRIMRLDSPFDAEPVEIYRTEERYAGIQWIGGSPLALVSDFDRDKRWTRTWIFEPSNAAKPPQLVWSRSIRDRYGDPGRPVTTENAAGRRVIRLTEGAIHLAGDGATPVGDRPFLDRMNLDTLATERLWRNEGEAYEVFVDFLDVETGLIVTRWETPTEPPNYFLRDLVDGRRVRMTNFEHPAPKLRDIRKELVTYMRADGVQLSATLYLPPDYREGERRPLVVWAYPLEYNDAATAGQVSGSPWRFISISGPSHLFFALRGYVVMDNATMPVVGDDPETVNDTFLDQVVASARAAIDFAAKERGVADPNRVGVGGHSYGAFMTANLLAHCDLFRAGIARSGAYNRTLTPFGFQSERRTFWEARDVYLNLSPFTYADRINEPLLMVHGQMDNNPGTFPIQSERLYHAVKGHGGTVRLVMLPFESHGYRAEESVMHTLAEMFDWFDRHVKGSEG